MPGKLTFGELPGQLLPQGLPAVCPPDDIPPPDAPPAPAIAVDPVPHAGLASVVDTAVDDVRVSLDVTRLSPLDRASLALLTPSPSPNPRL